MTTRRSLLVAGGTATVALTAGCLDFIRGDAPLEVAADPVLPSEEALEETGYTEQHKGWEGISEEVAGREVEIAGWTAAYTNDITIQDQTQEGALFACISMPRVEIAGTALNPLADMDTDELLEEFGSELEGEYQDLDEPEPTGNTIELEVLGDVRTIDEYETEATLEGEDITVLLWVASFANEDDTIVLLGGFPEQLPDEGVEIERLMESVEHPADREVDGPDEP